MPRILPVLPYPVDLYPWADPFYDAANRILDLDRINTVIDFFEDPCVAPWTVYAKSALPALGDAIIQLVWTSPDDVIRAYARPSKALRSKKRRGGRKKKPSKIRLPELGEEIGKRVPGQQAIARRHVSTGVRNLWVIDGAVQRALWYWLVLDVGLEFAHQWLTTVQESQECQTGLLGSALKTDTANTYHPLGGWSLMHSETCEKEWGTVRCGLESAISSDSAPWTVVAGASFLPLSAGWRGIIAITTGDEDPDEQWQQTSIRNADWNAGQIAERTFHEPGTAVVQVLAFGGTGNPSGVMTTEEIVTAFAHAN